MRKLRNIGKMNYNNDGNRSFFESIVNVNVLTAIKNLIRYNDLSDVIVINNLALSFHTRPLMDNCIHVLVKEPKTFNYFPGNKFRKNTKINIATTSELDITEDHFNFIKKTAYISDGIKIASPTALMSIYLKDFNSSIKCDAERLLENCPVDIKVLTKYVNAECLSKYQKFLYTINKDYCMSNIKNFDEYFKCKIYEGDSGYPEVDQAFTDWINNTKDLNQVLIGGMAIINYVPDRPPTYDADFVFLSEDDIPNEVNKFKHHRKSAFQHIKTHVEIEALSAGNINISDEFMQMVFDTAYQKPKFKIASPSAIVALKLGRFIQRDINDIKLLRANHEIDLTPFIPFLSEESLANYETILSDNDS